MKNTIAYRSSLQVILGTLFAASIIANSAMSVTSLPLIAARDWKIFHEQGLDAEIILMSPALTVPAMISSEIDYFAGVGPGLVSASLSSAPCNRPKMRCANPKIKAST